MKYSVASLFSVSGKRAVVTGGNSGIGKMMAEGLVKAGADVTIVARTATASAATVDELSEWGAIRAIQGDISTVGGIREIVAELGETSLDILVNNAGLLEQSPIDTYTEVMWDNALDLNLKAAFFLTQALLPNLRKAGISENPARVINISSGHGYRISLFDHFGYTASKAGLIHLSRQLAQKLAPYHINVNAIGPGIFASQQTADFSEDLIHKITSGIPCGRMGEAEDIVGSLIYLCSRAGAYTTSSFLPVDGGWASIA
jgi:NAD(P)-dependent dehydrogenase (short-subunit alcohol dehydrogenase family)